MCSGAFGWDILQYSSLLHLLWGKDTLMSFGWPQSPEDPLGTGWSGTPHPSYSLIFWGFKICSIWVSSAHSGSGVEVRSCPESRTLGRNMSFPISVQAEKTSGWSRQIGALSSSLVGGEERKWIRKEEMLILDLPRSPKGELYSPFMITWLIPFSSRWLAPEANDLICRLCSLLYDKCVFNWMRLFILYGYY